MYDMFFLQWNHDVLKGHRTGKIIMFTTAGSHCIEVLSYIFIIARLKTSHCSLHQIIGVCYFKIPQLSIVLIS